MHRNNLLLLFILLGICFSCIKPFEPEIKSNAAVKYVVMGLITDQEGYQTITVSKTSPLSAPAYIPVTSCMVTIHDSRGNHFTATEIGSGMYNVLMARENLQPGTAYSIQVELPDGSQIRSGSDTMPAGPAIDSIYFERKDLGTSTPGELNRGIQFLIDLEGSETDSRYYRWDITETWEYHAKYPVEWYYDGEVRQTVPPDNSRRICWRTMPVQTIFTLSTKKLAGNRFKAMPLHFVNNKSSRLEYLYSLLVRQIALSEDGYRYWDQIRANTSIGEGLYEQQPIMVKGNLQNITNPEQEVLGYFGASVVRSKRIFVQNVPDLPLESTDVCSVTFLKEGFQGISPKDYPGYLRSENGKPTMDLLSNDCVDCLLQGGTNVKPDFWPN